MSDGCCDGPSRPAAQALHSRRHWNTVTSLPRLLCICVFGVAFYIYDQGSSFGSGASWSSSSRLQHIAARGASQYPANSSSTSAGRGGGGTSPISGAPNSLDANATPGVESIRWLRLQPLEPPAYRRGRERPAPAPLLLDVFLGPHPAHDHSGWPGERAGWWAAGWGCLHVVASTYGSSYENVTADFDDASISASRGAPGGDAGGPLVADAVTQTTSGEDHTTLVWCAPALRRAEAVGVTLRLGRHGGRFVARRVSLPPAPFELAACTVVGQRAPGAVSDAHMLLPWLEYHAALGVGHFFLYVNGPMSNLTRSRVGATLLRLVAAGLVTLIEADFPYYYVRLRHFVQPVALMSCLQRYRVAARRLMFFDIDEYIFLGPATLALRPPRTLLSWLREREQPHTRGAEVVALACHRFYSLPALIPRLTDTALAPDGSVRLEWLLAGPVVTAEFVRAPSKYIALADAARRVGVHYMHEPYWPCMQGVIDSEEDAGFFHMLGLLGRHVSFNLSAEAAAVAAHPKARLNPMLAETLRRHESEHAAVSPVPRAMWREMF